MVKDGILNKRKILIGEKDMRLAYSLEKEFMRMSAQVSIITDSVKLFSNHEDDFEIIIMGDMISIHEWCEYFAKFKERATANASVIGICITKKITQDELKRAFKSGVNAVLIKPVKVDKIISAISFAMHETSSS